MDMIIMMMVIAVVCVAIGYSAYCYIRNRSLQEIRTDVYKLFLQAEHLFTETESGKQKMEWVLRKARGLLPGLLQDLISEEFLYEVIQTWFDAVKDLLDDGKVNGSTE